MMPSPTRGGVLDWADDTWAQVRAHGGVGGGGDMWGPGGGDSWGGSILACASSFLPSWGCNLPQVKVKKPRIASSA